MNKECSLSVIEHIFLRIALTQNYLMPLTLCLHYGNLYVYIYQNIKHWHIIMHKSIYNVNILFFVHLYSHTHTHTHIYIYIYIYIYIHINSLGRLLVFKQMISHRRYFSVIFPMIIYPLMKVELFSSYLHNQEPSCAYFNLKTFHWFVQNHCNYLCSLCSFKTKSRRNK